MNRLRKKATQAVGWRKESAHEEEKNRKVFVPWLQHKRKALNNDEKQQIKKSLSDLWLQVTTAISLANVCKQLPNSNLNLNVSGTIVFLAEHMYQMFVKLYDECLTMKEQYLHFQIKWHRYCSFFLWTRIWDYYCSCRLLGKWSSVCLFTME